MGLAKCVPFFALVLAACAAQTSPSPEPDAPMSIEARRQQSLEEIDQRACKAMGGEVRQDGMMGLYYCITPYADAGKTCRDSSECEGQCRSSDDVTNYDGAPGTQVGKCQQNDSKFGCYGVVEDGTAQGMICVD